MQPFPFGARGARPVQFKVGPAERQLVRHVPGVEIIPAGIACAPDVAWAVAAILHCAAPEPKLPIAPTSLPGYEAYLAAGFKEKLRPYQKGGVAFLATRAYAVCADAMRLGKSVTALAASILVGANRVLIICPETAKPVWRDEIAKWLPSARIATLYGRGADELRVFCHTCAGSGRVVVDGASAHCPDCKAKNGSSYGYQLVAPASSTLKLPALGAAKDALMNVATWAHMRCALGDVQAEVELKGLPDAMRTWPDWDKLLVESRKAQAQRTAQAAAAAELDKATHVLCNYDLLVAQSSRSATGKLGVRADLPGWSSALARVAFDVAIVDEAHLLRGFSTAVARRGQTRRDQCRATLAGVPRVWALTGTPIFGYVRDLWGLFDTISNGLFGNFFAFTVRYCLDGAAPVWMGDGTFKAIKDVRVGDIVWGWDSAEKRGGHRRFRRVRVLETFKREADSVEVTLASTEKVICTPEHLWASPTSNCVPYRAARAANGQHAGRHAGSVFAKIVDVTERPAETREYRRGYMHGLVDGDGAISFRWHLRPKGPSSIRGELVRQVTLRLVDAEPVDRCAQYAKDFALDCTTAPWKGAKRDQGIWRGKQIQFSGREALAFFYAPREGGDEYWRGWLAGIYDAEGWAYTIAQYRVVNPETYENIYDALVRFGFEAYCEKGDEAISFRGGRRAFFRFWSFMQPAIARKFDAFNAHSKGRTAPSWTWDADPVVSIAPAGRRTVHDIKTESGNFVAYGYGSHNCEGHKSEFGWTANGSSAFVPELMERAAWLMIKRSRQDVEADLPPQQYQIVRIEKGKADAKALQATRTALRAAIKPGQERGKGIGKALTLLTPLKIPALVDAVLSEIAEGTKVVVFAYLRESAETVYEALKAEITAKENAPKMRECGAKLWTAHGEQSADTRHAYAKAFRAHSGGGAFVTTYDSMQVAVSLGGAKTNHCIELHYSPAAILQAKERLNEVGSRGISNVFYVVENSEDERMLDVLLPKMKTLEETLGDKDAKLFGKAHDSVTPEESVDDMVARLTAHLADEI